MSEQNITQELNNDINDITKAKFNAWLLSLLEAELKPDSSMPVQNRAIHRAVSDLLSEIGTLSSTVDSLESTLKDTILDKLTELYSKWTSEREESLKSDLESSIEDTMTAKIQDITAAAKEREDLLKGRVEELEKDILIYCGDSKC